MLTRTISPGLAGSTIWATTPMRRTSASTFTVPSGSVASNSWSGFSWPSTIASAVTYGRMVGGNSASPAGVLNDEFTSQTAGPNIRMKPPMSQNQVKTSVQCQPVPPRLRRMNSVTRLISCP